MDKSIVKQKEAKPTSESTTGISNNCNLTNNYNASLDLKKFNESWKRSVCILAPVGSLAC